LNTILSHLLKGLFWHPDLPKDARTLRQTPCVAVDKMEEGELFYFGLVKSLEKHLEVADHISNSTVSEARWLAPDRPRLHPTLT
jgi:hypothetical protein